MSRNGKSKKTEKSQTESGITKITVCGFKSINREQSIDIRPLTILAGANSSGKSSIMQPLLLLKQTLEATYDPGPLLLNGPNVKFTSVEQFFSRFGNSQYNDVIHIGISIDSDQMIQTLTTSFEKQVKGGLGIKQTIYDLEDDQISLHKEMNKKQKLEAIRKLFDARQKFTGIPIEDIVYSDLEALGELKVILERCFLSILFVRKGYNGSLNSFFEILHEPIENVLIKMIHLPGARGNPERAYSVTAVGSTFAGTFEKYTASIIANWQTEKNKDKLAKLSKDLKKLGLTWKIRAKQINDAQVEIQVGRLLQGSKSGRRDLVNIADVGFGVSQTLPVLVALLVAEPGQLVYIEEPEIHLHPRAQTALAQILADAAIRGVRVVIETHSQLLLLGIQTLVAEGKLAPDLVKLHWFTRNSDGATTINSADLDETGAFGDWPEDFAETSLEAQSRYLDAAETHLMVN